jgi:hypothetical protein
MLRSLTIRSTCKMTMKTLYTIQRIIISYKPKDLFKSQPILAYSKESTFMVIMLKEQNDSRQVLGAPGTVMVLLRGDVRHSQTHHMQKLGGLKGPAKQSTNNLFHVSLVPLNETKTRDKTGMSFKRTR